tara:strand:+ start:364 stop:699 length:336 start_codon:yes stop_codon:yes gene_type:complete
MKQIDINTFNKVDIRVGEVRRAEPFLEAIKPAIKLWIEFGNGVGMKQSSAQITENYLAETLVGKKVVAVINLKPRKIGPFMSEVLVLGALSKKGITLLVTETDVKIGEKIH